MNYKKLLFIIAFITFLFGTSFIFETHPTQEDWPVPAAAKAKKNPQACNDESIYAGRSLYNKHCKSCHGKKGLGDGKKAAQLDTESGDFSKPSFQAQTDGAIFYKSSEGRDDMPSFKKKIPDDDDLWNVVNFIRTLKSDN